MKITDIRALCLSRPHEPEREWFSDTFHVYKADCPIVIIETDAGVQGISEPSSALPLVQLPQVLLNLAYF